MERILVIGARKEFKLALFFEKKIQFRGLWPLNHSQISRTESPEWRNPNQQSLGEPRVYPQYGERRPKSRADARRAVPALSAMTDGGL